MNKNITFPSYFNQNPNFRSLYIGSEQFVNYTHGLDYIKNIQLDIKLTFLVYVIKGQARFMGPDGVWEVDEGKAALLRKGGYIMSESLSPLDGRFKAFLFFLSDDLVREFCIEKGITQSSINGETECVHFIEVGDMMNIYLNSVMLMLDSEITKKPDSDLIKVKAKELLHHLYLQDTTGEIESIFAHSWDSADSKLKQVVLQNYCNKISIDQLAFLSGMSVSNFKRRFEKLYNTSPGKWIKEKRLEKSKFELTKTDKTIHEISDSIGFSSQSHFIQAFKAKFNVTPLQFHKQLHS